MRETDSKRRWERQIQREGGRDRFKEKVGETDSERRR